MWILNIFKRKKKQQIERFVGVAPKTPLGRIKPKQYIAKCAMVYNGKIIREFDVTEFGYSRDKVSEKIETNFKIRVSAIHVKR